MRRLAKLPVCPPPVWHMLWEPNPPCGRSASEIYLVFVYARRVLKLSLPKGVGPWREFEQLLEANVLSDTKTQRQILEEITEHPLVVDGVLLQADELAAFRVVCGEPCHA